MQDLSRTRLFVHKPKAWHRATLALLLAAGSAVSLSAQAQPASTDQTTSSTDQSSDQQLQEVVVTGSLIKRTDTETPSPVQVITAEQLKSSGYTTISDVLRNLSANGQGTLNQGFSGAFAAGASGVALHGLTVGATLTLIDGEAHGGVSAER